MDSQVVAKEKAAKYYGLSAYFLSKVIIEKSFIFLLSSLLYVPLFFLTGLRGVGAFFGTWLTVILHSLTVQVSRGCVALDIQVMQYKVLGYIFLKVDVRITVKCSIYEQCLLLMQMAYIFAAHR